jgi:hypothetical protein
MIANNLQPLRFDEKFSQTYPIGVLTPSIGQIIEKNPQLIFHESWDDLDYLKYCVPDFLQGKVVLVCHERSPVPGVDICVDPGTEKLQFSELIIPTLSALGLTERDLLWIHPDCSLEFQAQWQQSSKTKQIH